ncbi:hypothetical protein BB561_004200 [Smittium simulii]|uniref:Lon protease homolog, mitochondrial n=1 Tax=Smittium simulii TaxID=133385 RepID=A0A2T9YHI6_9FUNG|nr:hypothetical protein BB561_004200 [Smittium simulii]
MLRKSIQCLGKNSRLSRLSKINIHSQSSFLTSAQSSQNGLLPYFSSKLNSRLFSATCLNSFKSSPLMFKDDNPKNSSSKANLTDPKNKTEKNTNEDKPESIDIDESSSADPEAPHKAEDTKLPLEKDSPSKESDSSNPSSKKNNLNDKSSSSKAADELDSKKNSISNPSSAKVKASKKDSSLKNENSLKSKPNLEKNPIFSTQKNDYTSIDSNNNHTRVEVPSEYKNIFVLPIAQRPLFPGFYKAVVIRDLKVISLIKELLKKGEPFIGAFMLKNDSSDVDFIENADQVYNVGVFAQITSVFPSTIQEEDSLTVVLYSHRRIQLNSLFKPSLPTENQTDIPKPVNTSSKLPLKIDSDSTNSTINTENIIKQNSKDVLNEILYENNFMIADVTNMTSDNSNIRSQRSKALTSEIVSVFKEISTLNPLFRDQIASFSMSQSAGNVFDNPATLADFAAAVSSGEPKELQGILEELFVETRLEKSLVILKKELLNAQLQNKISKDVEAKIAKRQREFYLMEQLRGIKRELGLESDGKDKLIEKFKAKATTLQMPEQVSKVFEEEISKLSHLEPAASEFNVTRNYLDWLTQIPWGKTSLENYDIKQTKKILDEDHYGLDDVKDRILEFVAVGKLKGAIQGKILCFVGPPGVGKTSIGKSIARSLNREFYRFSVGGLSDVAEIKGHRRTYVGAMPGKVIQSLKKTGTQNPLILIDEIDKLGHGHQGDPASALLELLDPEQNNSFLDHYMDVPVDLSRILFVCTANVTDTIPGPLLDRMEVIRLSGYLADEKLAIAQNYLIPQAKDVAGLTDSNVNLSENAIMALIKNYCRESGVRNLKKHIEKIFRKSALYIIQNDIATEADPLSISSQKNLSKPFDPVQVGLTSSKSTENIDKNGISNNFSNTENTAGEIDLTQNTVNKPDQVTDFFNQAAVKINSDNKLNKVSNNLPMVIPGSYKQVIEEESLKKYVGPPIFTTDRLYKTTIPGVVMGLAWTSMGGSALYIESIVISQVKKSNSSNEEKEIIGQNYGSLKSTGHLGDVMKESSVLAYTYAQSFLNKLQPDNDFFKTSSIHLHVPEGATPKDGPSAGVTMTTSLLSLALNQKINPDVAMTGELTLTGKVLKIGGLKEKVIAAKRSGISRVIFPQDNLSDWEDLPNHIKKDIEGCPVSFYIDIIPLVGLKVENVNC